MNGDQVRSTWFLRPFGGAGPQGYDVPEVEDLLDRIAAELDGGRPVGPLIENTTMRQPWARRRVKECDIDAVDWFLGELLSDPGHGQRAELGADPWHDLGIVTQYTTSGNGNPAMRPAERSWRAHRKSFAEECQDGWRDFGQVPGTHLWWGLPERPFELRTADQRTLASRRLARAGEIISAGGRSFTLKDTNPARSSFPGGAELAAGSSRDFKGHYASAGRLQKWPLVTMRELVDEAGIPILCVTGHNGGRRACARITFPGQRWLRFPVRGTQRTNAIMTAVDQSGNMVARYRLTDEGLRLGVKTYFGAPKRVEIIVHPDRELTEELVLAVKISAPWLDSYFPSPVAGGGG